MKVVQLMLSRSWGGAERHVVDLCVRLQQHGVDVELVCRPEFIKDHGHHLHDLGYVTSVVAANNGDFRTYWHLWRRWRKSPPDLVHMHLSRATGIGSRLCRWLGIPSLATTHNNIRTKYFPGEQRFIATTHAQKRYLIGHGISAGQIRVIPNFSLFEPVEKIQLIPQQSPTFVSYGRFVPKKGFGVLLDAFKAVVAKRADAVLLIGGSGTLEEELKDQARSLGLGSAVQFVGWVSDPSEFLSQGDVFVLPSLDEPFGIVLLEAMAKGVTIVTSRASGPQEVLTDDNAWFAKLGSSDSLAGAMLDAITDREKSARNAETSLELYKNRYRAETVVPRIIEYYGDVLSPSHSSGESLGEMKN